MNKRVVHFIVGCIFCETLLLVIFVSLSFGTQSGWTPIGPEGGFLLSFAIAPNSSNVLYAGSDVYGGIYKSTDGGESWEFMGMLSELGHVLDIAIHPDSCDIVYAACGIEGINKTIDGGLNWSQVFRREEIVYSLGIDPNFPNIVYAGLLIDESTEYALYKSNDGGATWSDSSFQGNSVLCISFNPNSLNTVCVGTSGGVYRSTNAGSTWIFCGPPAPSATIYSLAVVDFNTFYVGTYQDARDAGTVYKTRDGGENWDTSYVLGTTVWSLAADPDSANILYMAAGSNMFGSEGVFKTTDGGDSWFPANNGLVDRMATEIKIDPVSSNIIYVTTDGLGGVYKSTNKAESWTPSVSGMLYTPVQAMCFDASHTLYAAVGYGTYRDMPCIFKSPDYGNSWDTLTTIPSPYYMTSIWDIVAYLGSSNVIYVGGMSHYSDTKNESVKGLLYRSNDGGETWDSLWTPDSMWFQCLAIDSSSGNIYAGTAGGDVSRIYKIYRSTDGGNIWEETSGWEYYANPIFDIAIDPISPNILYAGTGGAVFKSTDYGASWIPRAIIPFAYTLLIDPDSTNIIYAGSGGPYADSGGVSWERIGLGDHPITSLVGKFGTSKTIYAGTGGEFLETGGRGIFYSTDNGESWNSMNSGLTAPFILSLLINPNSPSTIYAGTMGGGIFKYTEEVGVEEIHKSHAKSGICRLSSFPIPFASHTQITYQTLVPSHVTLKIYDISGRLVKTLVNELKQSGHHTITWSGTDNSGQMVASGIYFCKLKFGNKFLQTKKLLFLR
jgi:photosystem II stability/assembly factor-like uncharacterized protein